jgi:hypothetical protein
LRGSQVCQGWGVGGGGLGEDGECTARLERR